jgi:hypothetical protein
VIAGVGAVAARGAAEDPDEGLLRLTAAFQEAWTIFEDAKTDHSDRRHEIEAMADYPPYNKDMESCERQIRFCEQHGADAYWDRMNQAHRKMGSTVVEVFKVPARTVPGAIEKLKIVSRAVGDGNGVDDELALFQEIDQPWIDMVIADLKRLVREG